MYKSGFMDMDFFELFIDVFGFDDWGFSVYLIGMFRLIEKKMSEFSFKFFGKLKDVKGFFKWNVIEELLVLGKYVEIRREVEERLILYEMKYLIIIVKCEGVMNFFMNLDGGVNIEDFFW